MTGLDGSGTQVLSEIVNNYVDRGVRVLFCRVLSQRSEIYKKSDRSGIVEKYGGPEHFVKSVDEALMMTEMENVEQWYQQQGPRRHQEEIQDVQHPLREPQCATPRDDGRDGARGPEPVVQVDPSDD